MRDSNDRYGPPGWLDRLLAGRSRADREVEDDAGRRVLMFLACVAVAGVLAVTDIFKALDLQSGLWALPAFAAPAGWAFCSLVAGHVLRPTWLAELRGSKRLAAVAVALGMLRLIWPLWATPAAAAWNAANGGLGEFTIWPKFPFGAVLSAEPAALGVAWFVLVLLAMTIAPARRKINRQIPAPPSQPESLRTQLLGENDEGRPS